MFKTECRKSVNRKQAEAREFAENHIFCYVKKDEKC
jgi:hypothetical protein